MAITVAGPHARSVPRRLPGLLIFAAMSLALGVATAPLWAPETTLAAVAHLVLAPLCHQLPERSFMHAGHAMAICHRCTAIYVGIAAGGLAVTLGARVSPWSAPMWLLVTGALGVQVALGWMFDGLDLPALRLLTGGLFGLWSGAALAEALAQAPKRAPAREA